ncbi:MAG: TonB-dependent receptor family protein [Tannerella sp.]|jgi:outer membrane receptor protein involved in Fe transport|nr:TonB-dependent receptor family protein [Tannerella sp.]
MRKKIGLALLMCGAAAMVSAAEPAVRVKGIVVEAGNLLPIDFGDVLLYVKGETQPVSHTMPDTEGRFTLTDIKEGEYSLMIRAMGFDIYTKAGIVLSGAAELDLGIITMTALEQGLAEVEIVAQKKQVIYKLDRRVVEASGNLLADGGTAVDLLENTPSIRVDADGEVTFRGSGGFLVYVDGKPSIFSGSRALEQIPSGQIENIEIITTPSARHDTDGDVGIINIITKKHFKSGLSGMVNAGASTVLSRNADFLLTRQNAASRWYAGGAWTERLRKSDFDQDKMTHAGNMTALSHSAGPRESNNFNYSLKAGYACSVASTSFNVDMEGGYGGRMRAGDLGYRETQTVTVENGGLLVQETVEGDYFSRDYYHIDETYFQGTVGFDHPFAGKGHKLSGSFYLKYGGDALEYFESDLYNKANVRQQGHRAWEDEYRRTMRSNLDYVCPYRPTGRVEAGHQYYAYLEDGDYSMQFWSPERQSFYRRDDIYNTFYFQRGIHSLYALLADSYKAFDWQAGVRAEQTHRVLRSSRKWANRTVNRMELFPSVHLGYTFPHGHRLMASVSYRTTRPALFYMEPYITYRDYYSAEIGNPDIRPEYIYVYELNYHRNMGEHSISATLFHRNRRDKIERLRVPYEAGVTLDSMANVGNDYSTGLELSSQLQPTRWWSITLNGSYYHYRVENELASAGGRDETSRNYELMLNNGLYAGKNTRIQLDGNFVGPSVTTQGRTSAFWYVNLSVRRQMFNRKLSGTLAFRDVFNSARYDSRIQTSNLESSTRIRPFYPLVTLSLAYTFNNFKQKSAGDREDHDLFEGTNH